MTANEAGSDRVAWKDVNENFKVRGRFVGNWRQAKAEMALVSSGQHLVPPGILMDYILDIARSMIRVEELHFKMQYAHRRVSGGGGWV